MSAAAKPKAAAKAKKPATHPPFKTMILEAIAEAKERKGSSRQAIQKFLSEKYKPENEAFFHTQVNLALARGLEQKWLAQDAHHKGSYRLPAKRAKKEASAEEKPKKKATTKKATEKKAAAPKAKKAATTKKAAAGKKAAAPKKAAAKKTTTKKAAAKKTKKE